MVQVQDGAPLFLYERKHIKMAEKTVDLKAFVRALKRAGRKRQSNGLLFFLDKKNNDLCACALGQGLLESGMVNEDEIKAELRAKGTFQDSVEVFDQNGKVERISGFSNGDLESKWMDRLRNLYGDSFVSTVYEGNDSSRMNIGSIVTRIFERFSDKLA